MQLSVTRFDNKSYVWLWLILYRLRHLITYYIKIFNFLNLKKSYAILIISIHNVLVLFSVVAMFSIRSSESTMMSSSRLFPACYAIWRSKFPSLYLAMWRSTWITNLKSALSQAFSVKLRAVVPMSAVTIFSRTRRGQAGDFRARKIACILASNILRYMMVKRRVARRLQLWNCEVEEERRHSAF